VSEPADGEPPPGDAPDDRPGGAEPADGAPPASDAAAEPPPTRRHATAEPSASARALAAAPAYPDDGPVAHAVRRLDHALGTAEQAFVFGLLVLVVVVAAAAALHDRVFADHLGRWWHYIVRGGTFATAMFAAVYATQQQRHLAMDLVSRRLAPRGRLVLGVALRALTIGVAALLFASGLHQRGVAGGSESLTVPGLGVHINDADIVSTISIGAALIALHALLHIAIDVEYLIRGKLPPERARSGH
jgi:TRAP-type C4-dicarboxylate transport system permease small subunit